jgi:hypothetical protein
MSHLGTLKLTLSNQHGPDYSAAVSCLPTPPPKRLVVAHAVGALFVTCNKCTRLLPVNHQAHAVECSGQLCHALKTATIIAPPLSPPAQPCRATIYAV